MVSTSASACHTSQHALTEPAALAANVAVHAALTQRSAEESYTCRSMASYAQTSYTLQESCAQGHSEHGRVDVDLKGVGGM